MQGLIFCKILKVEDYRIGGVHYLLGTHFWIPLAIGVDDVVLASETVEI